MDGGGPAEALEEADDNGGDVDLAGAGAMPGAGRVEWWPLCQLSPSEIRASGHTLVARS